MTGLDLGIIAVLLLSSVLAAAQGFFQEIFLLAGAVVGFLLAIWEYHRVGSWLATYFSAGWVADAAGFLTVFFACLLIAGFAGRICRWAFKEAGLAWFDRLLGAAFGLVRGVVVVTAVLMSWAVFAPNAPALAQSRLSGYFLVVGQGASWLGPSSLRAQLRQNLARLANMTDPRPAAAHSPAAGNQGAARQP